MTEKDKEDYKNKNICRYCGKEILSDKARNHCHLTGKFRGPAQNTCNINVRLKQSNLITIIFHTFSNYDPQMFFKRLIELKNDEENFDFFRKTNEDYISVTYGFIRFIDSYRFLSDKLDKLVKNLDNDDFIIFNEDFPKKWQNINKKLACPYQNSNNIDDFQKPKNVLITSKTQNNFNLKNEDFFSKLKNKCPDNEEIERTKESNKKFYIKNGEK